MPSVRENLIAARALIDTPEKWIKDAHVVGHCYCALGAVGQAYCCDPTDGWMISPAYPALNRALPHGFMGSIAAYNDAGTTTHADIMALFDRAIAAQEPTP